MNYLQAKTYQKTWELTSILVGILIMEFWINATPLMAARPVIDIKIDGIIEASEWGSPSLGLVDRYNVEIPEIDFHGIARRYGEFFRDMDDYKQNYRPERFKDEEGRIREIIKPTERWVFAMAFKFGGDALEGPIESSYEVFFDIHPEQDRGHPEGPWKNFRPDYRFRIRGKQGRIEAERYQWWDGDQWVGKDTTDAPEFEATVGGPYYECLIPWFSLGSPLGRSDTAPADGDFFLTFAVMSSQGDKHDYLPNYVTSNNHEITGAYAINNSLFDVVTASKKNTWGEVKYQDTNRK